MPLPNVEESFVSWRRLVQLSIQSHSALFEQKELSIPGIIRGPSSEPRLELVYYFLGMYKEGGKQSARLWFREQLLSLFFSYLIQGVSKKSGISNCQFINAYKSTF